MRPTFILAAALLLAPLAVTAQPATPEASKAAEAEEADTEAAENFAEQCAEAGGLPGVATKGTTGVPLVLGSANSRQQLSISEGAIGGIMTLSRTTSAGSGPSVTLLGPGVSIAFAATTAKLDFSNPVRVDYCLKSLTP